MIDRTNAPEHYIPASLHAPVLQKIHLDNSIEVFYINKPGQGFIKLETIFNAGTRFQQQMLAASTTASQLIEGSNTRSGKRIAKTIDYYGAHILAETDRDKTAITLISPIQFLAEMLPLYTEILEQPTFPKHELEVYKTKNKRFLETELQKVKTIAQRKFVQSIYGAKHIYGQSAVPGDYDALSIKHLNKHHETFYAPQNATVIIAGEVNKQVIERLNNTLGQWKKEGQQHTFIRVKTDTQAPGRYLIPKEEAVQAAIRVGLPLFNRLHEDYHSFRVLNTILGGYFGSRLMKNIREDKGFTYGINAMIASMQNAGYLTINSEVGSHVAEAAIAEIFKEIKRLRTEAVPTDELTLVQNYMSGELMRNFNDTFTIADSMRVLVDYNLGTEYFTRAHEAIKEITAEKILELANKYLIEENFYTIIAG